MKEGVNFEGEILSVIFFADDLILISRPKRRGMERLIRAVKTLCEAKIMKLAVDKTMILTAGSQDSVWTVTGDGPDLQ